MTLKLSDARNGARHLACDSCDWKTHALQCAHLPSQVWHAFELDHDDAMTGCAPIVADAQLRARYEAAFDAWAETTLESSSAVLPIRDRLQLAS